MPDWSNEVYTIHNRLFRNNTTLDRLASLPLTMRQAMCALEDPNDMLSATKKGMYARSEPLLVKKRTAT